MLIKEDLPLVPSTSKEPDKTARVFKHANKGSRAINDVRAGLEVQRAFTKEGTDPFEEIEWELRDAVITGSDGKIVFEQRQVEFPKAWSQTATNIVVQKYFRGTLGAADREHSVRQMIARVADTIFNWGKADGYFKTDRDAWAFRDELVHLMLHQKMAFNSPVWFNVGVEPEPQCSACFINSVDDSMASILTLAKTEGMLFKYGSGAGSNLSSLRSSRENLKGGGTASGPVSFMKGLDAFAGAIKSGGKTRRAAKMVILNVDHPDVVDFVDCKAREEKKAWALIDAGYNGAFNVVGGAYDSVSYQNANHSVRVTDEFMNAVLKDESWSTKAIVGGRTVDTFPARELMRKMADAAWICGDPGIQFDTTVNDWHTSINTARINASNPCCFVGETLVETSEGRMEIRQLAEMAKAGQPLPLALSYDFENRLPVAKQIKAAWKAGDAKMLVRVTTERGLTFLCTPEHRWYLRDGSAVQAKDLVNGQRLAKLNFWRNDARSNRRVVNHRGISTAPNGTVWFNRWLWEQVNGTIPEGWEVHHKNENTEDDRLNNYELVDGTAHRSFHSTGEKNPRFMDVPVTTLVEIWETIELTPRLTHKKKGESVTPARWNQYVRDHGLIGQVPMAQSPTTGGRIQGMPWVDFAAFVDENRPVTNDKIESVEFLSLDSSVAVYDIEVEDTHNFGIACPGFEHALVVSNSEYMYLDDSACNLASLNLRKFQDQHGDFTIDPFRHAVRTTIAAMEILVDNSSYPTEKIAKNSWAYRPLGLGFANLGALLMSRGLPYDSEPGRVYAAGLTALMCGEAYKTSAMIAKDATGPFAGYSKNEQPFLHVMRKHRAAVDKIDAALATYDLTEAAKQSWDEAIEIGQTYGFRNGQTTVLAPTGTIAFLMDCDTTGIEPDLALVKYKSLVGGGMLKLVNGSVAESLRRMGYNETDIHAIVDHIDKHDTIEGATHLKPEHLPVFDCAFRPKNGDRSIHYMGHIRMMSACQPFLSGAISKTVNLPGDCTVEDIEDAYIQAWKLGLKAIAVYRDGSKRTQPLSTGDGTKIASSDPLKFLSADERKVVEDLRARLGRPKGPPMAVRYKLPDERASFTRKFAIGGHEGYVTVGLYEDGSPGEIFVRMAKEGSTIGGLMDAFATAISMALQHGVPLPILIEKFKGTQFEPRGFTGNPEIPMATSIMDYLFKWLAIKFPNGTADRHPAAQMAQLDLPKVALLANDVLEGKIEVAIKDDRTFVSETDAPSCHDCGTLMVRNGACHKCQNCGSTSGCS